MKRIGLRGLLLASLLLAYLTVGESRDASIHPFAVRDQTRATMLDGMQAHGDLGYVLEDNDDHREVIVERGRYSKVFRLPQGIKMMRISTIPIHYQDADGAWQEIDATVLPSESASYELEARHNEYKVFFREDPSGEALVRYEARGGEISFGVSAEQAWGNLRDSTAEPEANQVIYKEIFQGVDLRYEISPLQFLEEFIIHRSDVAAEILEIEKRFSALGVTWALDEDGSISFQREEDGVILWRIPRPVMYEQADPLNRNYDLHFEIQERDGYVSLKKVLEPAGRAWMMASRRQYPIVIDDTINLDEDDLSAAGDGIVRTSLPIGYQRLTDRPKNGVGYLNGLTYRSFLEWDTSAIPDDTRIQALGLYLYVTEGYGPGDTIDIVQIDNPVSSYSNNNRGNQDLFNAIGNETTVYQAGLPLLQSTGLKYIPLGVGAAASLSIQDLESKLIDDTPFGIGLRGSDETVDITAFGAAEAGVAYKEARPDLVIFYNGVEGSFLEVARPLRNGFWDGTNYWVFFRFGRKMDYFFSPDGEEWTLAGRLATADNRHHTVWYEAGERKVWATYHEQGPPSSGYAGDMIVMSGTISGTTISWTTPSAVFGANLDNGEGYDFPTLVRDTDGYCWVVARYYVGTTGSAVRSARSSNTDCSSWEESFDLTPWIDGAVNIRRTGGSVVPLTNGQVYGMYKYNDGGDFAMRGRLFDGTTWASEEIIDPTSADGVYIQGFSALSISDEVHLVYIDKGGDLMYVSRESSWEVPIKLDIGIFFSPSLSLDKASNDLYVFYRTDSLHSASGHVYYRQGKPPYDAENWSKAITLTSTSWSPQKYYGPNADYPLFSNYSGEGKVFVVWVEGIWGLEFREVVGDSRLSCPLE